MKRAEKESWTYINGNGRGGNHRKYPLATLPSDIQEAVLIYNKDTNPDAVGQMTAMLPVLSAGAAARAIDALMPVELPSFESALAPQNGQNGQKSWTPETAISEADLQDPRIKKILAILREVDAMPRTWANGKRRWIESVAMRHAVQWQSVYRWMKKYEKRGIAGLRHTKSYKDQPKVWTPEAIDFWVSVCGKREHRGADHKDLYYNVLVIEAQRRDWRIGGYESANGWFKKRWNPLMEAMQRGGLRALDNLLPPVLRDYSDLAPFEMLVGDQHRFDRWVVDEETGEVFRPEGYLWQDLRTRVIYGAAVDKKYDAWLIGLALRLGVSCYGAFTSIYTDNGKPELSKYLMSILANLRSLGMEWQQTDEVCVDLLDVDGEDVNPCYLAAGTHKKAIVKNAKAKMIEGTFYRLERIMASVMLLPGQTKRMSEDIHWQDIDRNEAQKLAEQGKLLTAREFAIALYQACDYYNREKAHRGVRSEWAWKPVPAQTTPYDCLRACYDDGWRPRMISREAADLIFLARGTRVVNKGCINLENDIYVHDALLPMHKAQVDIRYNPMTLDECHVFQGGRYICTATPVERSSMKDMDLAARKIAEKKERRRRFAEEFKRISTLAPDFRQYSQVPEAERVAALIGADRKRRAIENKEATRPVSQEELTAHIEKMEQGEALPPKHETPLPPKPDYFRDEFARYQWILKHLKAGGELAADDAAFREKYEAAMKPDERERWQFEVAYGG